MKKATMLFFYGLLAILIASATLAIDFNIVSPEPKTYNTTLIPLSITGNETFDWIKYNIDGIVGGCLNCSAYSTTLNLSAGNHTLYAEALKVLINQTVNGSNATINTTYNKTFNASRDFRIVQINQTNTTNTNNTNNTNVSNTGFNFYILNPQQDVYADTKPVPIYVVANRTLEKIIVSVNGQVFECNNCSQLQKYINLSIGNYTLTANGKLGNLTKYDAVNFTVKHFEEYYGNYTKFGRGFEKLPKDFENGLLTDEELADIILSNKLNPGVINRLIKTGMLGNESLNAILETQFNPQGIFKKLLSAFGLKEKGYAHLIYEYYNLTPDVEIRIVLRDDLPEKYQEKVREKLEKKIEQRIERSEDNPNRQDDEKIRLVEDNPNRQDDSGYGSQNGRDDDKKVFKIGKQNKDSGNDNDNYDDSDDKVDDRISKDKNDKNNNGKSKGKPKIN